MRGSSYKNDEKAIALAWFLHVGGDIHNPLHNASRVTELEPKGDQGGNLFTFVAETKENPFGVKLHWFWDSIIGRVIPRINNASDEDYLAPIGQMMMNKYEFSEMQNRLKLGDYKSWNIEGFGYLNENVYTNDLKRNEMPSGKYTRQTFEVSEEQITLAGYRLGETLNRIFGEKTS